MQIMTSEREMIGEFQLYVNQPEGFADFGMIPLMKHQQS
jgi:hypothetical protein